MVYAWGEYGESVRGVWGERQVCMGGVSGMRQVHEGDVSGIYWTIPTLRGDYVGTSMGLASGVYEESVRHAWGLHRKCIGYTLDYPHTMAALRVD